MCLNLGHFTVECTSRTHYRVCHSNAHTIDQCEYKILKKSSTLVRRIQPQQDNQEDGLRLNTGMMIDRGMMTAIDPTEIGMKIIGERMIDEMSTV